MKVKSVRPNVEDMSADPVRHVVVVGGGMVAQRFVESLRSRDPAGTWRVTVVSEEDALPYDRVALTSFFDGRAVEDLALGDTAMWDDPLVALVRGVTVEVVDRTRRVVTTTDRQSIPYDHLVLATGSYPFVPPVQGTDLDGVFVYRTIEDVRAIQEFVQGLAPTSSTPVRAAVVGGGLLGLEAAGALTTLGAATTVVEHSPHLMARQVDQGGGEALHRLVTAMGVSVVTSAEAACLTGAGSVASMEFTEGAPLDADVVVFAAGVRPRDELARDAGLSIGDRGGVVVDECCRTTDDHISAIGEVACIDGRCLGLVAPGNAMAEVVCDRLLGGTATFTGADMSTKLKLLGVDVASFGDAFATAPGALEVVYADPIAGVYKKLVLSDDATTLLGGILVGDASAYASLRPMVGLEFSDDPASYLMPEGLSQPVGAGTELPDAVGVCSCNNVSAGQIRDAVRQVGCTDVAQVKKCTRAGSSCGSCLPLVKRIVNAELESAGVEVASGLCEHFTLSRPQLFEAVRVTNVHTFTDIITRFGSETGGRGCDICKPVVASILASLGNGHILAGEQAALQDTNDHVMANIQRDGTYSVVPRIPGGEVTPEGLLVIGQVAKDYGLYTKITGGQRIDMFGARIEQLPYIWKRLTDAGFESGHAYGKSLRTVKSCVGSTWCRFGVQDSVSMAIELELRYRGLRSPHKLKLGVSGCARECAEARGKDVGVIATENGWNMYVGGNGGFTPRHAQLFAEDLDSPTLIRTIDRFLMYYVRTADRLQRTAPWLEEIEGGLDFVREVIIEDSLGIATELDAAMTTHVDNYEDEWKAALSDPETLSRFASFVNAPDQPDPSLTYVSERGQGRPANDTDKQKDRQPATGVLIAGSLLEVRG